MVICCAAVNCSNRQGKGEKRAVSFHRFPLKDSKRLIQWLKAVQRDNWTPTKYSFLCSEHFTKDSFSKRLEDQHRLLKPTAVPSIFHLAEKKKGSRGHVRSRRKEAGQPPGDVREPQEEARCEVTEHSPLSVDEEPTVKEEVGSMEQAVSQSEQGVERPTPPEGSPGRTSADNLATEPSVPRKPERPAPGACTEPSAQAGAWNADKSGISIDDFTPLGSGACKFIGSLHSYSFSSRHTRERPSLPKEQLDRKRLKRDVEPGCSRRSAVPGTCLAEGTPTSSLTATPQKPSQSSSAPPPDVTPKPATEAALGQKGDTDASPMSINEVIMSASGACKLIDSLHSYCFSSRPSKSQVCCLREQVEKKNGELKLLRQRVSRSDSQVKKLREKLEEAKRLTFPCSNGLVAPDCETPKMNPSIEPLSWMLGTWLSEPPGDGIYPTLQPFHYLEEVHITHVGQPMLNFSFNAFHPDTKKPMHRECGFIRLKPDSNKVAFVSAQNTGIVEVEEGEVNGQELCIASHSIARISFAAEPRVEQIMRKFRLNAEGRLEQTVSMATTTQPMTQHLHITYKKVTP
ncbi:peroxynitrite isomerase THAP4 isoform X1 [Phascolarctos cinereus]|uniref:THAP domain-containing protein 4 isoform X1 n=1 Tax=Phascolarctos cinereus TaxID=38626 RepID=A0A6P5KJ77_PHACI|nr:THAP domain-containing protein 4 isoform X1 [Phascolarctos cinereus]